MIKRNVSCKNGKVLFSVDSRCEWTWGVSYRDLCLKKKIVYVEDGSIVYHPSCHLISCVWRGSTFTIFCHHTDTSQTVVFSKTFTVRLTNKPFTFHSLYSRAKWNSLQFEKNVYVEDGSKVYHPSCHLISCVWRASTFSSYYILSPHRHISNGRLF